MIIIEHQQRKQIMDQWLLSTVDHLVQQIGETLYSAWYGKKLSPCFQGNTVKNSPELPYSNLIKN